ncbi:C-type lectin domain family 2 member D isoform X4 [Symphalangus syndactylus]|uniref:C-type lectin domain family 2 member D isoform X4 n=1 Tax=Symphalangus syndactylus TaxID=9590 RepID=UPI00300559AD
MIHLPWPPKVLGLQAHFCLLLPCEEEHDCFLFHHYCYLHSKEHSIKATLIWPLFFLIMFLTIIVCGMVAALSAIRANCHQKPSVCLQAACPESWIGFQRKCFYFSDDTKNWTSSQRFCDSQDADLAQVESFQELNFLLRYKGPSDHWIGLSREQGQPWKWINGTEWTRQFPILGAGECAYLNDKGASSARHYTERKWICSKSDIHV